MSNNTYAQRQHLSVPPSLPLRLPTCTYLGRGTLTLDCDSTRLAQNSACQPTFGCNSRSTRSGRTRSHFSSARRQKAGGRGQKDYCLYSKLFNLFQLDSYFRPAGLAQELNADLLLLDDMKARRTATERGLAITGILGILDQSASMKFIDLPAAVQNLQSTSFWASDSLFKKLLDKHC